MAKVAYPPHMHVMLYGVKVSLPCFVFLPGDFISSPVMSTQNAELALLALQAREGGGNRAGHCLSTPTALPALTTL